MKLTYLLLLTKTRPWMRWIRAPLRILAKERGITVKTLREHLHDLERRELIALVWMRDVSDYDLSRRYTIVVLDEPTWIPEDTRESREAARDAKRYGRLEDGDSEDTFDDDPEADNVEPDRGEPEDDDDEPPPPLKCRAATRGTDGDIRPGGEETEDGDEPPPPRKRRARD